MRMTHGGGINPPAALLTRRVPQGFVTRERFDAMLSPLAAVLDRPAFLAPGVPPPSTAAAARYLALVDDRLAPALAQLAVASQGAAVPAPPLPPVLNGHVSSQPSY